MAIASRGMCLPNARGKAARTSALAGDGVSLSTLPFSAARYASSEKARNASRIDTTFAFASSRSRPILFAFSISAGRYRNGTDPRILVSTSSRWNSTHSPGCPSYETPLGGEVRAGRRRLEVLVIDARVEPEVRSGPCLSEALLAFGEPLKSVGKVVHAGLGPMPLS